MKRLYFSDSFKNYLIIFLLLLGVAIYTTEDYKGGAPSHARVEVSFFFHPLCPHCQKQKKFNSYLKEKYPELKWAEYDVTLPKNAKIFSEFIEKNSKIEHRGVPRTFIGSYEIYGFDSKETTGASLENAILAYIKNEPSLFDEMDMQEIKPIEVPLFGKINYQEYSLFWLAVVLGLVDGFNPCAMWVLVYLISMIATLSDRRKIWFLVGTFILASGVLYFLFMSAWLNAFLFLGYVRLLTLGIGLVALGAGALNIREYIRSRGEIACSIGDIESKEKTIGRIERIVRAPLSFFTVLSIIALAFMVNSVEFACSAALPAIFTHTLSLSDLSTWQYYGYILIYDFFFMLDDLIIFTLAVMALDTDLGRRYTAYSKIIGGVVLVLLGSMMLFFPQMLR